MSSFPLPIPEMVVCPRFSVELRARGLDDPGPVREVGLDLRCEFLRSVSHRLDSVPRQALEEIRPLDHGDRVVVALFYDLARGARRRHEAVAGGDVEAGQGLG